MHLIGLIMKIYHDALSSKRQKNVWYRVFYVLKLQYKAVTKDQSIKHLNF